MKKTILLLIMLTLGLTVGAKEKEWMMKVLES